MSHPARAEILRTLSERVASPSDMAKDLDMPVTNVAHHFRVLLQLQCIEEVDVRPVRGALEHRYRSSRRMLCEPNQAELVPATARHAAAVAVMNAALDDLRAALEAESFDERASQHLTWTPLVLDEQGWDDVYAMLFEVWERALAEERAAAKRLENGETGGPEVRSRLSMFHHTAPPAD